MNAAGAILSGGPIMLAALSVPMIPGAVLIAGPLASLEVLASCCLMLLIRGLQSCPLLTTTGPRVGPLVPTKGPGPGPGPGPTLMRFKILDSALWTPCALQSRPPAARR